MRDMTEQEARAALKKEMPWAKLVEAHAADKTFEAEAMAYAPCVCIEASGPTLRTAVRRCIAAARKVGAAK